MTKGAEEAWGERPRCEMQRRREAEAEGCGACWTEEAMGAEEVL